ncbi:transcription factor [Methylobacterium sp. Leaf469]|uniref:type II toxin-antitoxin system VapB family antitoxin n=1 Tax=unclassified Methylobacterium TaxID=2615210 RepID=UPI0006F33FA6|nr:MULTISPECIES: type II toxin-antitoxin system VapB family antitoxin [unclassified Methylobacterium]KQO69807.1 transcription factor [Methylobacterium sp. Leaf87]KQT87831.1 transcription factor [Methylobacterium sp. Leaf469]
MALNIRSEEVNQLAETLASAARVSKTEAVRMALVNELARREAKPSLLERIKPIQDAIAAYPRTGLKADKAFYDDLSGEP